METKRITNPNLAFMYCKNIAKEIKETVLRKVALDILEENEETFLKSKGSDWQHHSYPGGLIVHTCNVALNSIHLAEFYNGLVSNDLVRFCALMHDVGKLFDYRNETSFNNSNLITMNQDLLGHGFEGASYVANKLRAEYSRKEGCVSRSYAENVITQVSHCIGAHMDGFGACAHQKMFEVIIIGCADKTDAYLEQTILESEENKFVIGTGETFYKSVVDHAKVLPEGKNILQNEVH